MSGRSNVRPSQRFDALPAVFGAVVTDTGHYRIPVSLRFLDCTQVKSEAAERPHLYMYISRQKNMAYKCDVCQAVFAVKDT